MPRLNSVDPDGATGKTKELLDVVRQRTGRIPNMVRLMANSPAALGGYLNLATTLAGSTLSAEVRDSVAILVAADGESDYTLAAVSALARKGGLSDDDIERPNGHRPETQERLQRFAFPKIFSRNAGTFHHPNWTRLWKQVSPTAKSPRSSLPSS
jgi:hypothetical protein